MDKREYYKSAAVARDYEALRIATPSGRLTQEAEVSFLKSAFRRDQRLLELACGTGRLLRALRQEGWQVAGVDGSAAMLEAGPEGKLADVFVGDVFDLPFPEASFDGAYCLRFTNHYGDLRPFFSQCRRVLRPGACLVFDSMRWSPLLWESRRWGGANHPVSDVQVRAWLAEAGFAVESVAPLFPIGPYLLSALPLTAARMMFALTSRLPASLQAIAVWRARRTA